MESTLCRMKFQQEIAEVNNADNAEKNELKRGYDA